MDGWDSLFLWLQEKKLVDTWMLMMWLIWNNKNQSLHNLVCKSPADIARNAIRLLEDNSSVEIKMK